MRCAIYVRVSSEKQENKGLSLEAQKKTGMELTQSKGWTHEVFEDAGISAEPEGIAHRPALVRMLDSIEEGNIQRVFVTEIDRLARNPATLSFIKKVLQDNQVKVVTQNQVFDFEDDEDDFISDLLGLLAKRENRIRVRRSKRARLEGVLKGKWRGGILPYGYAAIRDPDDRARDKILVPDEDEAKVFEQMVEWCLQGLSTRDIALRLNALGIPTKGSKIYKKEIKVAVKGRSEFVMRKTKDLKWKPGTVYGILKNPIYKGEMRYLDHTIRVPHLIGREKWETVQKQLRSNYNSSTRNIKHFYLLRGLLFCRSCGRRLYGWIRPSRGMRVYCCLSKRPDPEPRFCGLKNIHLDRLNLLVWNIVRELLSNSEKLKQAIIQQQSEYFADEIILKDEIERLTSLKAERERELYRILDLYGKSQILSVQELDKQVRKVKDEIHVIEGETAKLERKQQQRVNIEENLSEIESWSRQLSERIDHLSDQEKYELLHLVIDKIIVDYHEGKGHSIEVRGAIPLFEQEGSKQKYTGIEVSNYNRAVDAGLIGGGSVPRPGEVSLAHHGVLFLDELPEFNKSVLEVLRQPLEAGEVTIARARVSVTYPANVMLVAAMNPCPCGYATDPRNTCSCSQTAIQRYMSRISGPLLDRIDIHIEVPAVKVEELAQKQDGEQSEAIRERVEAARERQRRRFEGESRIFANAHMGSKALRRFCPLPTEGEELLTSAITRLGLSARAYDRIIKVSRTIADLAGSDGIQTPHLAEAIQYRSLDRQLWLG